jgi:hypothetical protein
MIAALDRGPLRVDISPKLKRPSNAIMIGVGDSRTAAGGNILINTVGVTRTVDPAQSMWGGLQSYVPQILHADDFLSTGLTGGSTANSAVQSNFGISGQRSYDLTALPRPSNNDLNYQVIATHPACVIILMIGVNNTRAVTTDVDGTAAIAQIQSDIRFLVNYWTTPANCGGLQKIVFLMDELSTNVNVSGVVQTSGSTYVPVDGLQYRTSRAFRGWDYRQAGGIPQCVVIPAFDVGLDVSSAPAYRNIQGVSNDGLHGTALGYWQLQQRAGAIIRSLLAAWGFPDMQTPLLATAANNTAINGSGALFAGTTGSLSGGGQTLTGQLATGWKHGASIGTGSLTLTGSFGTNSLGERTQIIAFSWTGLTALASTTITYSMSAAAVATAGVSVGDRLRFAARVKLLAGSSNCGVAGLKMTAFSSVGATRNFVVVLNQRSPLTGGLTSYTTPVAFDMGGEEKILVTPVVDTAALGTNYPGIGGFATTTALTAGVTFQFGTGSGNATFEISQASIVKVP